MRKTKIKPADRAALIDRIEHALTNGLTHPGTKDGPIALPLPMFSNNTMPGEMARQFAEDAGLPHANAAKLVAEALVDLLEKSGETGAAAVRAAANAAPPPAHPQPPGPRPVVGKAWGSPPPRTPAGQASGPITVTVNGETVMTKLEDLKNFSADVQPGSQPPFWKKVLIMAALDGVTRQAFRRIDITTDAAGGFTVQARVA